MLGMSTPDAGYYRRDLALVHHLGFGFHADMCAPGILELLEPAGPDTGWSWSSAAAAAC
jgi:hypothetical protein